jgi:hypothetical protein
MAQFGVHRVEARGDVIDVAGRCYTGPLRRGEVFRCLMPDNRSVRLTIERIVAYRHDWEVIDEGLTALISLTGEGGDALVDGVILVT